jgi:hypothetical protein
MSAALLGAQAKSTDNSGKSSDAAKTGASANAATVTFTGCVSPGTTSDSFYLTNSKEKGVKAPATTMKLVQGPKKVGIGTFVTQGVEVTGTVEQAENGSPSTLTVTKIKSSDSGC